jgi:hypothetical protein
VTQGDAGDRSEVATSGSIFDHSQVYPTPLLQLFQSLLALQESSLWYCHHLGQSQLPFTRIRS